VHTQLSISSTTKDTPKLLLSHSRHQSSLIVHGTIGAVYARVTVNLAAVVTTALFVLLILAMLIMAHASSLPWPAISQLTSVSSPFANPLELTLDNALRRPRIVMERMFVWTMDVTLLLDALLFPKRATITTLVPMMFVLLELDAETLRRIVMTGRNAQQTAAAMDNAKTHRFNAVKPTNAQITHAMKPLEHVFTRISQAPVSLETSASMKDAIRQLDALLLLSTVTTTMPALPIPATVP